MRQIRTNWNGLRHTEEGKGKTTTLKGPLFSLASKIWIGVFIGITGILSPAGTQSWGWALAPGAPEAGAGTTLAVDAAGRPYQGGVFEGTFGPAGVQLEHWGGDDIYLAAYDADGIARWAVSAGSSLDDAVNALVVDTQGSLVATGSYWVSGAFGGEVIRATPNIKGIFLVKYRDGGQLQWVKAINGSALKEVRAMAIDSQDNIYVTGFFSGRLLADSVELTARGRTDLFLLKFDTGGRILWAVQEGTTGDTRAMTLALSPTEDIVIGGFFNDTLRVAGDILTANTNDRDVFIAQYDSDGMVQWARKAGGVHDDEITQVAVTSTGDIIAAGYLVGVMSLNDTLRIQSRTGNADFYLLRYRPDGRPVAARAMGGLLTQQTTGLTLVGEEILVSGIYQGEMTIDGQTFSAGAGFGSFVAAFDQKFQLRWLKNLPTAEAIYLTSIVAGEPGTIFCGGSFSGIAVFDRFSLNQSQGFAPVLGKLQLPTTAVNHQEAYLPDWNAFPNPVREELFIRTSALRYEVRLIDSRGRLLGTWQSPSSISVRNLPTGMYVLLYQDANGTDQQRVIVSR